MVEQTFRFTRVVGANSLVCRKPNLGNSDGLQLAICNLNLISQTENPPKAPPEVPIQPIPGEPLPMPRPTTPDPEPPRPPEPAPPNAPEPVRPPDPKGVEHFLLG
jgi:hypothetical protein